MAEQIKTVILVHGAFADGSSWGRVAGRLIAAGVDVVVTQTPLTSLAADVAVVLRAIEAVDGPVLLAGHSWGGAVITEAGRHDKVAGLVYAAAGAPDSGQSFNDWWKDYPPAPVGAELRPFGPDGHLVVTRAGMRDLVGPDLPPEVTDVLAAIQGPLVGASFGEPVGEAAWRLKPTFYVVAEQDQGIPPVAQRDAAARMGATTLSLPASHLVILSQAEAVAGFILEAIATF